MTSITTKERQVLTALREEAVAENKFDKLPDYGALERYEERFNRLFDLEDDEAEGYDPMELVSMETDEEKRQREIRAKYHELIERFIAVIDGKLALPTKD